ncbi:hypothetical protein PCK2_000092 [Pneumocystis canis]|nr:hypothetical protein PCK2_000092 [Pneumocystis canis]
MSIYFYIQI